MKFINYTREHANEIANTGFNRDYPKSLIGKFDKPERFEREGWSYTLMDEDKVIYVGGIHPLWQGVGEVSDKIDRLAAGDVCRQFFDVSFNFPPHGLHHRCGKGGVDQTS